MYTRDLASRSLLVGDIEIIYMVSGQRRNSQLHVSCPNHRREVHNTLYVDPAIADEGVWGLKIRATISY
ncbi:hypothetical protein B6254_0690 [Weissella cibaria]|uniref:Uncharacterized protein n=1 Tax=Weissella cibaria TaxID=137591 RepID=A0A2S1KQ09_9LACO|nr:hypothetical protein B6254_0690 [Weissella cibaria]